jgi:two-component system sensor histidine kinase SenX3
MESHLVTALRNLLTNAINYSPRGTRVAVASRLTNDVVEISVTDQGMGIPENELQRVFERFYRVDQARSRVTGGTGWGCRSSSTSRRTTVGEVGVWSVLGEGSTFTLRLPPYTNRGNNLVIGCRRGGEQRMSRILVVEDEQSFSDASVLHAAQRRV